MEKHHFTSKEGKIGDLSRNLPSMLSSSRASSIILKLNSGMSRRSVDKNSFDTFNDGNE